MVKKRGPQDKPWMAADEYGRSLGGFSFNLLVRNMDKAIAFQREVLQAKLVYGDADFAVLRIELPGGPVEWMLHADHTYGDHPLLALTGDNALASSCGCTESIRIRRQRRHTSSTTQCCRRRQIGRMACAKPISSTPTAMSGFRTCRSGRRNLSRSRAWLQVSHFEFVTPAKARAIAFDLRSGDKKSCHAEARRTRRSPSWDQRCASFDTLSPYVRLGESEVSGLGACDNEGCAGWAGAEPHMGDHS